jgi:phospholipid-transporting ATPase
MYNPQTYHHIQEIQKYNIQDYRPRYDSLAILALFRPLTSFPVWNNSKRPSARYAKYSGCESNAATPSLKQTSPRPECYKHTTRRGNEADMERWRVRDRRLGDELVTKSFNWITGL